MLNKIIKIAQNNLIDNKHLTSMCFWLRNDEIIALDAFPPYDTDNELKKALLLIGMKAYDLKATAVITVMDAAMKSYGPDETYDETSRPLTYPKQMRTEVIICSLTDLIGTANKYLLTPYKEVGDGLEFSPTYEPYKVTNPQSAIIKKGYELYGQDIS